jgi:hypothetical protein
MRVRFLQACAAGLPLALAVDTAASGGDTGLGFGHWPAEAGNDGDVMKVRVVLLGILVLAGTLGVGAGERMTLKVSPAVAFAPANLIVRATIVADPDNRAVEIVAESDDFYRSSEIQLEGERAAKTNTFEFRSLPPGAYEVRANLLGADGQTRAVIRQQVNVLASGAGER